MHTLIIALMLLMVGAFIFSAVTFPFAKPYRSRRMRFVAAFANIMLGVGGAGFLGSALSALGGLNWLPPSFEWPVGYGSGIISMPDGTHVVPHRSSGRVQVYDPQWRFLRGWHVDAGGGTFKLLPAGGDRIEVITARGDWRYTYTLDGHLVTRQSYSPASYLSFPEQGERRVVPTRPWLWLFSSPIISFTVGALGMGVLGFLERKAKRRVAL